MPFALRIQFVDAHVRLRISIFHCSFYTAEGELQLGREETELKRRIFEQRPKWLIEEALGVREPSARGLLKMHTFSLLYKMMFSFCTRAFGRHF